MKLRSDQLHAQLKKGFLPVYLISGDEPLQVGEACDALRTAARSYGFAERHVFHVDNQMNWGDFFSVANSLSLFASKQLIELRMPNGKPGDAGTKAILEYLQRPSADNVLLIITDRLDTATQKTKWFKAVEQAGAFIQVWPIEAKALPQWLQQRAHQDGYKITPEALAIISERVEGNLLAAQQEVEKLKLLAPHNIIDDTLVTDAVADSARFDVFQLVDVAVSGDVPHTIRIFDGLYEEGMEPTIMLWALSREIRLLSFLCREQARGINLELALDSGAKLIGAAPFMLKKRVAAFRKNLSLHSDYDYQTMLQLVNGIDKSIKGIERADTRDQLLQLVLFLAGIRSLSLG